MILGGELVRVTLKDDTELEFDNCANIDFTEDRNFVHFRKAVDENWNTYHRIINKDNIKEIYFEENVKQELELKKALAAYNPFEKEEEENEKEAKKYIGVH